ncbi:hypothetical protein LzC2_17750 [Planctomycetes bacterium LzC2]|uniref:Uncharacterized protein n=2 Tax=Alienimonas chondri TaxID=2681879 RepID=A0ABX1VCT9_9PLAN|nr:hypothetical protein [Alienimonas chondri]
MVDFEYLIAGMNALARAHRAGSMSGHLGAAVAAGYFIGERCPDADPAVVEGIEAELNAVRRGESVFSPPANGAISVAEMFAPFPKEAADETAIATLAEALARNIDRPRQSGHNVIFASIAVRGLTDHPDLATPARVDGLRKLIAKFDGVTPGNGDYGPNRGRIDGRKVTLSDDDGVAPYQDLTDMATRILTELVDHAAERRIGFGGLWHVVNHAAALVELAQYGFPDLAAAGLPAHREHLRLWKTLPDLTASRGAEAPTAHDPRTAVFWTDGDPRREGARLTHRVKTLYGYDELAALVDDAALKERANRALRYLM